MTWSIAARDRAPTTGRQRDANGEFTHSPTIISQPPPPPTSFTTNSPLHQHHQHLLHTTNSPQPNAFWSLQLMYGLVTTLAGHKVCDCTNRKLCWNICPTSTSSPPPPPTPPPHPVIPPTINCQVDLLLVACSSYISYTELVQYWHLCPEIESFQRFPIGSSNPCAFNWADFTTWGRARFVALTWEARVPPQACLHPWAETSWVCWLVDNQTDSDGMHNYQSHDQTRRTQASGTCRNGKA